MTPSQKNDGERVPSSQLRSGTVEAYTSALRDFAKYFNKPPDQLGPEHIRQFQLHLLRDQKLAANTVKQRMAAMQFFFARTLKRPYLREDFPLRGLRIIKSMGFIESRIIELQCGQKERPACLRKEKGNCRV